MTRRTRRISRILRVLFNGPLIRLINGRFQRVLLILIMRIRRPLRKYRRLMAVIRHMNFDNLQDSAIEKSRINLLKIRVDTRILRRLLRNDRIDDRFINLTNFFGYLYDLVTLEYFTFIRQRSIVVTQLNNFLEFKLKELKNFLEIHTSDAKDTILIVLLREIRRSLSMFSLLLPLFQDALRGITINRLNYQMYGVASIRNTSMRLTIMKLRAPRVLIRIATLLITITRTKRRNVTVSNTFKVTRMLIINFTNRRFRIFITIFIGIRAPRISQTLRVLMRIKRVRLRNLLRDIRQVIMTTSMRITLMCRRINYTKAAHSRAPLMLNTIYQVTSRQLRNPLTNFLVLHTTRRYRKLLIILHNSDRRDSV